MNLTRPRIPKARIEPAIRRAMVILLLFVSLPLSRAASGDAGKGTSAQTRLALPSAQQLVWHDYEVGMFIHFGPSTFLDHVIDWPATDYRDKDVEKHQLPDRPEHQFDPKRFNPGQLDTDQWVAAAEAMGARYLVMVAKHHGGFCVWQTDTSEYGVRNTPWRGGRGDIMADLSESCRKRGLPLGVYLSPQDHVHGAGGGGRCQTPRDQERYNRIYRQQLTELLTRYGRMCEIWFDGGLAVEVGDIIRQHAPDAVVFQGPQASIRWVGNEDGFAPYPCWNAVAPAIARSGVGTAADGKPDGEVWMPCECDTKIRGQWHWASDKTSWGGSASLKSLEVLMNTYYRSVGRGQVLLLNQSPDPTGRITDADFARGKQLGAEIRRRFGQSLARTDGHGTLVELDLGNRSTVDHVITMEDIAHGERIRSYVIEGRRDGEWMTLCEGTAVGHKRIDQFPPASVDRIRLRVLSAAAPPVIRSLAAYQAQGVTVRYLKDYDPAAGSFPLYQEPQTRWQRLRSEEFLVRGAKARIITPEHPLPGKLWLLERGVGEPAQVARALLEKGVYFVSMDADDFGTAQAVERWNALHAELVGKRGFSPKVALEGYSRSGLGVYNWASENPEKVACIYLDAPVLSIQSWPGGKGQGKGWPAGWAAVQKLHGFTSEAEAMDYRQNPVDKAHLLAQANVPILHVCGDKDNVVPYEENTGLFQERYEKAGGRNMTIIIKGGMGHWTHGLKDPTPIVDFILQALRVPTTATSPAVAGPAANRIEIRLAAATSPDQSYDLSSWILEPGQYDLLLRSEPGQAPPRASDLVLLIDGAEASPYLTPRPGQPGRFNLNITATRSWPKGSLVLQIRSQPAERR